MGAPLVHSFDPLNLFRLAGLQGQGFASIIERGGLISTRHNARGPHAAELNRMLGVDGDLFGAASKQAVIEFQRMTGCKVDGIVGPETLAALRGNYPISGRSECEIDHDHHHHGSGSTRNAPRIEQQYQKPPTGTLRAGDLARDQNVKNRRSVLSGTNGTREGNRTINGVEVRHPPANASTEEKFNHYQKLIEASGGQVDQQPGQRTMLALRGMDPNGNKTNPNGPSRRMNDSMVVLWRDQQNQPHVEVQRGSTYPGQSRSRAAPDVTRDGKGDVGMVTEGNYRMHARAPFKGSPSWHMRQLNGSGQIPGVRNTDQNWSYSDREWADSKRRGDNLSGVLFHRGRSGGVSSIGCQNAENWNGMVSLLGGTSRSGRPNQSFNYTIINAHGPENR